MINENYKDNIVRLANWMTEHPKVQRRICEDGFEVTPEEFIEIMEMLEGNGFYEMIFILIVKNRSNPVLEKALSRLVVEKVGKALEEIGARQMCEELKGKIREEIKLKEINGVW